MNKEVIEILLATLKELKKDKLYKLGEYGEKRKKLPPESKKYEGAMILLAYDIQKIDYCLTELNKLNDFEFPTDDEIERLSNEYLKLVGFVDRMDIIKHDYIQGSTIMRDYIKGKLLW